MVQQLPTVASGSLVAAWSMTCDADSSYAQVGWWKDDGWTNPYYFYEYNYEPTGNWYTYDLGQATFGSNNNFKVGCDSTKMYFIINSITYGTVNLSSIPFTRSWVQLLAETQNTDDRCPGTVTNPVSFGSAQYKNTSNTWVSATCPNAGDLGQGYGDLSTMRNNISSSGSTNWEIWDSRN